MSQLSLDLAPVLQQPLLFDTIPGIDPGPLPTPIPGTGEPEPDYDPSIDPDPTLPPGPETPGIDPGFPGAFPEPSPLLT